MESEVQVHDPRPTKSSVFSVRFPNDELWEVRRAAQAANVSVGEFIRHAALDRARTSDFPAVFAGAMARVFSDVYASYAAAGSPSGESLEDMNSWLGSADWIKFINEPPKKYDDFMVWLASQGSVRPRQEESAPD